MAPSGHGMPCAYKEADSGDCGNSGAVHVRRAGMQRPYKSEIDGSQGAISELTVEGKSRINVCAY